MFDQDTKLHVIEIWIELCCYLAVCYELVLAKMDTAILLGVTAFLYCPTFDIVKDITPRKLDMFPSQIKGWRHLLRWVC
jgi:hypothetical protein